MIQHCVLLRFNDELPAGQLDRIRESLDAFVATLPGVDSYRCGANVGADTNHAFGIAATFTDMDAWAGYDQADEHMRIRRELILPWLTERAGVQFAC